MELVTLGRTGLKVSKAGLGCGGHARIGQAYDLPEQHSVGLVQRALDLGVNFIDTATDYRTETIVGKAIQGRDRSKLVIASKHGVSAWRENRMYSPDEYARGIDASLRKLDTDYIDLYLVHGLAPDDYDYARNQILPVMRRAKEAGKIRHIAASEVWIHDPGHAMLQRALPDDPFDVVMAGFNLLNPSARRRVFPLTQKNHVGTLIMFAVRTALSKPDKRGELMRQLIDEGKLSGDTDPDHVLDFLLEQTDAESIPEAAYRFCAHEPGADVILTGTGHVEHLEENIGAILAGPLPPQVHRKLGDLFGHVDSVTGN